jgi:transposase-like protein
LLKFWPQIADVDNRAIKRRCASMAGFKSFANAAITLAGIELAHRIRKGQFSFGRGCRHHISITCSYLEKALLTY